jgi:thioredoxin 1
LDRQYSDDQSNGCFQALITLYKQLTLKTNLGTICASQEDRLNGAKTVNEFIQKCPALEVDDTNFESEVFKSKTPVVALFWAPWSQPCAVQAKALSEAIARSPGQVKFVKINADNNPDLSIWYAVQSIPTLLYFVNGTIHGRIVGTTSAETLLSKINAWSQGNTPTS